MNKAVRRSIDDEIVGLSRSAIAGLRHELHGCVDVWGGMIRPLLSGIQQYLNVNVAAVSTVLFGLGFVGSDVT